MALMTDVLDHVSIKAALVGGFVVLVLYVVALRVDEYIRIRKIGSYGIRVKCYLPFDLDFAYRAVKATMQHKNLELWRDDFGARNSNTLEVRVLGKRMVFTADPENIKALLAAQFADFGKGEPFREEWHPFLGDSIFTTDGDLWHTSRQMLRPQFIRDRVSDLHCFESHVQTLFKAIANGGALEGENQAVNLKAANGKIIEVSDLLFRYTLDVATDFLLGKDVKSLSTPRQEFAEAFAEVQRVQNIMSRAGPLRKLVPLGSYHRGIKVMNKFVTQYIDLALQLSPEELAQKAQNKSDMEYTFLHELASRTRDPVVIRDQLVAVLLAGRDTTAGTLSWTMYELGRNPQAMAALRREIVETVGLERPPTFENLKSMKYLQNVMSEILRLYPAVPFNMRLALRDATLPRGGGPDGSLPLAVLKDTPIAYSTILMQRREDLYPPISPESPDPQRFVPERWTTWQPKPWLYIPFNGGPRICIGQQFALAEMGYTLVRIFQRFEKVVSHMDDVDGGNPTLKAEIVLQPGDGVRCAFWEAQKSG